MRADVRLVSGPSPAVASVSKPTKHHVGRHLHALGVLFRGLLDGSSDANIP